MLYVFGSGLGCHRDVYVDKAVHQNKMLLKSSLPPCR